MASAGELAGKQVVDVSGTRSMPCLLRPPRRTCRGTLIGLASHRLSEMGQKKRWAMRCACPTDSLPCVSVVHCSQLSHWRDWLIVLAHLVGSFEPAAQTGP